MRDRHRGWNAAQIDAGHTANEAVRIWRVEADGAAVERRDASAVCHGGRLGDFHSRGGEPSVRAHVVAGISGEPGVGSVERKRAAREMASEIQIEIEGDAARDVRRLVRSIEPAGEVDPGDREHSGAVPARNRGVEGETAIHRSARALHPQIGGQAGERPLKACIERGVDRDIAQAVQDAAPLLECEPRRVHLQIEHRRPIALHHAAVQRERRLRGLHEQMIEAPALVAIADAAGQLRHGEIGGGADECRVCELQRPVHRLIAERQARVEVLEIRRHVGRAELKWIPHEHAAVHDLDGQNLDRPSRAAALLPPHFALHQRAEVPAAVALLRGDNARAREADAPNDGAVLPQLAQAVAQIDFVNRDDRRLVAREPHVAKTQTAQQRSFQVADLERRRQVLVRLADDQRADLVLGPARFQHADAGADEREHQDDQVHDAFSQEDADGAERWTMHAMYTISTIVPMSRRRCRASTSNPLPVPRAEVRLDAA